jgi:hypothetical protein
MRHAGRGKKTIAGPGVGAVIFRNQSQAFFQAAIWNETLNAIRPGTVENMDASLPALKRPGFRGGQLV